MSIPWRTNLHSIIEQVNETVYISTMSIPDFIESDLKGTIPDNYTTAKGIDLSLLPPALEYCNPEELEKIIRAGSLKRQVEWLCGRIALKELLCSVKFPGLDFRVISITYDASGRPCISGHEDTGISVTHSGEVAMAALHVIPGKRIGIDIERGSGIDLNAVMSVAYTQEERLEYKNSSPEDIIRAFTLKEAYLKLTGQGFHEVINRVSVKGGRIFYDKKDVPGIATELRKYKNEYILSMIYEL